MADPNMKLDLPAILYRVADDLRSYERLIALPSCNDCGLKGRCEYEPHVGMFVRINCPHWESEGD